MQTAVLAAGNPKMGKWGDFLLTSCLVRTEEKSSRSVGILPTKWGLALEVVALLWAHVSRSIVCVPFLWRTPMNCWFWFSSKFYVINGVFLWGQECGAAASRNVWTTEKSGKHSNNLEGGKEIREGPHFSFTQLLASRLQQGHWWANSNSSTLSPSKHAHPLYLFYSSWDLRAEHFSQGHRVNNKLGFRSNLTDATVYSLSHQTVWPMCYLLLIRTHGNSWLATVLSFGRKQKVGDRTEFSSLANCPRSNN